MVFVGGFSVVTPVILFGYPYLQYCFVWSAGESGLNGKRLDAGGSSRYRGATPRLNVKRRIRTDLAERYAYPGSYVL